MKVNYINEKKMSLLAQSSIISSRLSYYIPQVNIKYANNMVHNIVKDLSEDLNSRIMITDINGKVIVDSFNILEGQRLNNEELALALIGKSTAEQYIIPKYGRVMYVAVPITNKGRIIGAVFISSSLEDIYKNIKEIMKKFMILSLLSMVITGFISFVFADIISTPIERLTEAVKRMAQGKFNQKVEISGNDEISNLGKAFNLMTTKLEQVDKQRREFVANVSHELRTPLSSIKILAESLIHQEKVEEKIYKEFLKDIDSEVDRLNRIIDSLLSLVDLEKENLNLDYQITYVNYLIEKVINSLKPLADKKNIKIYYIEREKIQIMLDQFKIQQSLINVIGNAIKYTPENGEIFVELYSNSDEIIIKVRDTGIGIPKEDIPFIFDRFYRVDKARARKTGGTGLGLSITQQIIALHQGRIEVESRINEGTTFYIFLPKKAAVNI
ncbi:sensor histidine kinase [Caminicella sporogenes]|uniref:sensor histidine kinase n=1 Tax=Caminicella sporogenes TaxID=166485 RepID=UPI00253FF5ED|nr:ATP-binding protein [Caminicella sporogenes]WIF94446.1 ATP-binding protein [Caminicella sporogenes]